MSFGYSIFQPYQVIKNKIDVANTQDDIKELSSNIKNFSKEFTSKTNQLTDDIMLLKNTINDFQLYKLVKKRKRCDDGTYDCPEDKQKAVVLD
jgi:hypothetical protein